jgi:hypothetical protein
VTEKEWQERYEITSTKGRIWKRSELRKRASEMLKSLSPDTTPVARRTAIQLVLDDPSFMRCRKGEIPARVIADAAIEAMLRLSREDSALAEQIALVDKTIAEIKKEDDGRYRALLARNGIDQPLPTRSITEARWVAAQDDWWVCIDRKWYWWDRRASAWMASLHGPGFQP